MTASPRILLTGAGGFLGEHLLGALAAAGVETVRAGRRREDDVALDLDDPEACAEAVSAVRPDCVLHAAARSRMGDCEADPEAAERVNGTATGALARAAPRICHVSTDLVFGGDRAPYRSGDPVDPRSVYGASKLSGERAALAVCAAPLVVRVPLLFGPSFDGRRGATDMLRCAASEGRRLGLFTNEYRTPLHVRHAAEALVALALSDRTGVFHLAGPERVSRHEFAQRFAAVAGERAVGAVDATVCSDPQRPSDVSLVADLEAAVTLDEMLAES